MGRTVPSFRMAEAQEVAEWNAFRKALPKQDRVVFDDMLGVAKLYASASSAALRTSRFEGMVMAVIFHHYKTLTQFLKGITEIEQGDGEEEIDSFRR